MRRASRRLLVLLLALILTGACIRVAMMIPGRGVTAEDEANGDSAMPAMSADGRFVAFESTASNLVPDDTNGVTDIFIRDRQQAMTTRVSSATGRQANGHSSYPAISADGRFVAFQSLASNLVAGDTNRDIDIFVHDRDADGDGRYDVPGQATTTRISIAAGRAPAPGGR